MTSGWIFTEAERQLIRALLSKGRDEQERNPNFAIISFKDLYALLTDPEAAILQQWLAVDPESIGYKLPYIGVPETEPDLVAIVGQQVRNDRGLFELPCQYLPRDVFQSYLKMNAKMKNELNKGLFVNYGYRSPARQVFMFFDILESKYDFDFQKTIRRVCFPDYSEHVCYQRQAIDFTCETARPSETFHETDEYAWLQKNAARYGFLESYPEDNNLDMMYEPWHWHFEAVKDK